MPSHHQSAFFEALRKANVDLVVHYYESISPERKNLGWHDVPELPCGEQFVPKEVSSIECCHDWRERVHVVPGNGSRFLRSLASLLSREGVSWMHWSEPASPGLRWWLSYPGKQQYARLVNTHASAALAIGELARRDFLRWGIAPEKIRLLPYAVEGFRNAVGYVDEVISDFVSGSPIVFLYVGSLCHNKGVDILLAAFGDTVSCFPGARLVLVGPAMGKEDYRQQAKRLGIEKKILFRGVLPTDRIGSVLAGGQVLILPSRYDGWGMVINEAASAGKAIIATDACGAAYHLVEHGINGFRVPRGDVAALAERMRLYAADPFLAVRHGKSSQALFKEYSPERNGARLLEILESL